MESDWGTDRVKRKIEMKGEKKRVIRAQTGKMVDAEENVLAVYHFKSLCLPVSVMQSHGGGK